MPRRCSICHHECLEEINQALVRSATLSEIAALFRVSDDSLSRHKVSHLPAALVEAAGEEKVREALDVVAQLKAVNSVSLSVLKEARDAGDGELALKAVDRIQRQIELQAKLLGELDERPVTNIVLTPEWVNLRLVILRALEPFPAARAAVAEAIDAGR